MANAPNPVSGDLINSEGEVVNVVSLLGGNDPTDLTPPQHPPNAKSGLVIGADGKVYDITKLLSAGSQRDEAPEASEKSAGKIIQYTGATTSTMTHGHFYECVASSGSYAWVELALAPDGSGLTATIVGTALVLA